MAKFPHSPGPAALGRLVPAIFELPAGARLARVYYTAGRHPTTWNSFRHVGPTDARWDHHLAAATGEPQVQERGVYYAAADANTCLAEVFQLTRRIDRIFQAPWLVIFDSDRSLRLLDLSGDFATRMGASMAIHSGPRDRARRWACDLYEAFPDIEGLRYASSMHGGAYAFAFNERALLHRPFPVYPLFNRALADDSLVDVLKHAAQAVGYALR